MIISHRHRFAFVHVPKCAGTSVHGRLAPYDDLDGAFYRRVEDHPELGAVDLGHMPLITLRDHFPDEFSCVKRYWSFAVVRAPRARFCSAIAQRLKMYRGTFLQSLSDEELSREISSTIDNLRNLSGRFPPDLIHFQPQVDYVMIGDERVVDELYRTHEIDQLFEDVARRVGIEALPELPNESHHGENRSYAFKSNVVRVAFEPFRPVARSVLKALPQGYKQKLRKLVYRDSSEVFERVGPGLGLDEFVAEFYAADLELLEVADAERRSASQ